MPCREDDYLQLERKIKVKDWDKRVNMGILGFCVVEAWKLYKAGKDFHVKLSHSAFHEQLADALIENSLDRIVIRSSPVSGSLKTESPSSGGSAHFKPVKRCRILQGQVTPYARQGRCPTCVEKKSSHIYIYSMYHDEKHIERYYCLRA